MTIIDTNFIDWIKKDVFVLYGSHKNNGLPCFQIKTSHHKTRRIDYIFRTNKGLWGCIEFEHGDTYGEITVGAIQLDDFYSMLQNGSKIIINNVEINIQLFLLATKYSQLGYLYKNDKRIINYGGYQQEDSLYQENNTIFHATRWMWRFCGRDRNLLCDTNPIGVSSFSVIRRSYDGRPEIELNGHYKIKLGEL